MKIVNNIKNPDAYNLIQTQLMPKNSKIVKFCLMAAMNVLYRKWDLLMNVIRKTFVRNLQFHFAK